MSRLSIWETIKSFSHITNEQAKELCKEFLDAIDLNVSIYEPADEHIDFVEQMYNICAESDHYGIVLNIDHSEPVGDPFYYSRKVNKEDIFNYINNVDCSYFCTICGDNYDNGGVELSCQNPQCLYCPDCIVPWVTENVAKCPNCSTYIKQFKSKKSKSS